jgi:septal ring factor EnvC (AmiA/AmiB activator)
VSDLPPESEKLLAVSPDEFVEERKQLVKRLRDKGRTDEASAVSALRKPSAVVLAVNRAARDRPKAAAAAAKAAAKVEKAQAGGDLDGFRAAMGELDEALDLLGEVAVAHVSPSGKKATDAMRRRVHDLLRRAVAAKETRAGLERGVLLEEQEAAGFGALPAVPAKSKSERSTSAKDARAEREAAKRREREAALRSELAEAEAALEEAEKALRAAEREREKAERAVTAARAKLERLR